MAAPAAPLEGGTTKKVPRGRDRWRLAALPCDWQIPRSGCAASSGCWHSPKVRTALTDNGDVSQLTPVPAVRVAGTEIPRNLHRPGLSFGTSAAGTFSAFNVPRRSVGRLGEMAEKRRSPCALSVKAHAFSVEALIGAEKRRKTAGEDAASPEDGTDVSERTESPALRAAGACASDRGSECASVGSRKFKQ